MPKYVVLAPAIFVNTESGRMRDRKKQEGAVISMSAKEAQLYLDGGQVKPLKEPKAKPKDIENTEE